jgi:hypothetical protein
MNGAASQTLSAQVFASCCDDELTVFDAAQAEDAVGEVLEGAAPAFHDHDFQTIVMIQMDVRRGKDAAACMVLRCDEFLGEIRFVVVVDDRKRAHHNLVFIDVPFDQVLANQVADRFGAVAVAFRCDRFIERREQLALERQTGSHELTHLHFSRYTKPS